MEVRTHDTANLRNEMESFINNAKLVWHCHKGGSYKMRI